MSTTVTYKGQTLATVSNQTKTLLTEGKYLEDDLTLVDVSGGGSTLITKNISANGTYNASSDSADGYSQVTVAVPASAVDTGTKSISTNGTHDVVGYASASVSVPNSYSAGDEGKVVSNGALVAQTAHADVTPTASDQTIDTTTNNSIKVKGDGDLVAGNIKKDVEIFGVTGSYEGGGGVSFPNLMNFEEVLVTSTATAITVQLTPSNDCAVLLSIKDIGEPDETMYKSLFWSNAWINGTSSGSANSIMRPNGTIGSDGGLASFNLTTGVFTFGNGPYGKAFAGDTYYVYQFSVGE